MKARNVMSHSLTSRKALAAARAGVTVAHRAASLHRQTTSMRASHDEYKQLRRLASMVKSGKMSRTLIEFVDPKGVLSANVRGIPSVESLDVLPCGRKDRRTAAALEGLKETIATESGALADWLSNAADGTHSIIETIDYHVDGMMDVLRSLKDRLASMDESTLSVAQVSSMNGDACCGAVRTLKEVLEQLEPIEADSLRDPEYCEQAKAALAELCEKLRPLTGMIMDGDEVQAPEVTEVAAENLEVEGTPESIGWDKGKLCDAVDGALELAKVLKSVADRRGEFVAGILDAKESVPAVEAFEIEDNIDTKISEDQTKVIEEGTDAEGRKAGDTPEEGESAADKPAPLEKTEGGEAPATEGLDGSCDVDTFQCLVGNYVHIFTEAVDESVEQILAVIDLVSSVVGDEGEPAPEEGSEGAAAE